MSYIIHNGGIIIQYDLILYENIAKYGIIYISI